MTDVPPRPAPNAFLSNVTSRAFWSNVWSDVLSRGWITVVWLVFTGAGSTLPLFFLAAHHHPGMGAFKYTFSYDNLAKGDLLLIAMVLIAGTSGDLVFALCAGKLRRWVRPIALLAAGAAIVFGGAMIEYVTATTPDGTRTWGENNAGSVASISYKLAIAAVVVGWATLMFRSAEE
jgi:hypothetical protein